MRMIKSNNTKLQWISEKIVPFPLSFSLTEEGRQQSGCVVATVYLSGETYDLDSDIHNGDGRDDRRTSAGCLAGAVPGLPPVQQVGDVPQASPDSKRHFWTWFEDQGVVS